MNISITIENILGFTSLFIIVALLIYFYINDNNNNDPEPMEGGQ